MFRKRVRLAGFLLLAAFAIQHGANASLVTVLNPSFEAPDVADGGFSGAITSWVSSGTGVFDPTVAQLTPTHGSQVAFANPSGVASQVLSATLSASTLYTLLVDVGDRTDLAFGGYTVNLYAGATLIASDTNTFTPPSGGFLTSTSSYLSLPAGPLIGLPLKIELKFGPPLLVGPRPSLTMSG
jgi:hypothetical protein